MHSSGWDFTNNAETVNGWHNIMELKYFRFYLHRVLRRVLCSGFDTNCAIPDVNIESRKVIRMCCTFLWQTFALQIVFFFWIAPNASILDVCHVR